MPFEFITLAGQIGHGKDETADRLLSDLGAGWSRARFATGVYAATAAILDTTVEELQKWKRRDEPFPGTVAPVRRWLQQVGDGARAVDPDVWINREMRDVGQARRRVYVDGRYLNEVGRAHRLGGFNVLVYRPGKINDVEHPSESSLRPLLRFIDEEAVSGPLTAEKLGSLTARALHEVAAWLPLFHHVLRNDRTVADLHRRVVEELLPRHRGGG